LYAQIIFVIFIQRSRQWNYSVLTFCNFCGQNNGYIHFHKSMSAETENSNFFQLSRKITLSKIIEPRPNSNLNCSFLRCIYMSNLSWMCTTIREIMNGNLKFLIFFKVQEGITLSAIIKPWPNSKLNNAFLWHIHIFNLSWICTTVGEIMNVNWKLSFF
jgi:hypothetical protein